MVDSDGNRVDYYRYLKDFVDEKESQGYKNWKYNYLDELDNKDDRRKEQAITMTVGLNVPIPGVKGLTVDGQFMYERTNAKTEHTRMRIPMNGGIFIIPQQHMMLLPES